MSEPLPDPLVPGDVDLRGYEFMPFYGDRAFGSEAWLSASNEGRLAMLALWWRAYAKELPAGSLPDNDVLIRAYAGYAANPRAWAKLRGEALCGFIKCSDGRLYHKVVSAIAIEAWEFRNKQRHRTEAARLARQSQRLSQTNDPPDKPSVTASIGQDRTGQDKSSTPLAPSGFALEAGGPENGAEKLNGHDPTPPVELIPLVGDAEFPIYPPQVQEFERAYPAVDVPQTLREIRAWCLTNPNRRKTKAGALRFVNSWLSREQNGA